MKFGAENVPTIVNPRGLKHNFDETKISGQIVVTDVETHNGDLRGEISAFRANHVAKGMGKLRVESGVTQNSIKSNLLPLSQKYKTNEIYFKPVDLAFFDGECWNIMELKAGGDLDSSNAPSNVEKLLTIYVDMGIENCKAYFATLYNKDGEGNTWKGAVKKHLAYGECSNAVKTEVSKHLSKNSILCTEDFWDMILPVGDEEISKDDFIELYSKAFIKSGIEKVVLAL